MEGNQLAALLALGANLCFSSSSIFFARYSHRFGTLWMNAVKSSVALVAFGVCHLLFFSSYQFSLDYHYLFFLISGFIGLGIGDIFLIKAFVDLGPAKTLVLFSFQPMIFLFLDASIFGLEIQTQNIIAVFIFILCLVLFSVENLKANNSWNFRGLSYALIGIFLDGAGIFLTKKGFIHFKEIDGITANAIRCLGAVIFYALVNIFIPINVIPKFKELSKKLRYQPILISFTGTFLSLFFYLNALKVGALSIVTAIGATGPIFTTILESVIEKKKPSTIHYIALGLFLFAFYLNFKSSY